MTENKINLNELLHRMLTDDCWHTFKWITVLGDDNPDYLADNDATVIKILREVPKRYGELWDDFDNKYLIGNRIFHTMIISPTFITNFLNFSINWFKAHDDKCEECRGMGKVCNEKLNSEFCPACQGTGHKWHKELAVIGGE